MSLSLSPFTFFYFYVSFSFSFLSFVVSNRVSIFFLLQSELDHCLTVHLVRFFYFYVSFSISFFFLCIYHLLLLSLLKTLRRKEISERQEVSFCGTCEKNIAQKKIRDAFSSLRGRVHIAFLINFDKFSFLFSSDMGIKGARHRFFAASLLRGIASSHRHRFSTSLLDIASRHRFSTRFSTRWSTPLLDSPSRFASRRRFSIPWSIR